MRARTLTALLVAVLTLTACSSSSGGSSAGSTVTLVTHDSFAVSKPVLRAFTKQTGITVKVLKSGDAGAALNQAILTKDQPLGDAFFGVDNTFLSRALDAGIFVPYTAKSLDTVPAKFQLDAEKRLTPIDYGDVCVNYDKAWFAREKLAVPHTLDDLTDPQYRGRLVVENPATSSPGLAFLLASVALRRGWNAYWMAAGERREGRRRGEQAYRDEFSAGLGHDQPLVELASARRPRCTRDPKPADADRGATDTCFRQVELAGVLRGAQHPAAARKLIDFMLSEKFQADIPVQMFVFPARAGTPLPRVFTKYAKVPARPFTLPPAEIGAQRDNWIKQWTTTVLR
jgi:thiamine transport system substrate-binding protein